MPGNKKRKAEGGSGAAPAAAAAAVPAFNLRATARLPMDMEAAFVNAQWETPLTSIPNLGEGTARKLSQAGIHNTYNLCGQFLMLKTEGDNSQTRANAFCAFLDGAGVARTLHSVITYAVAKKLNRALRRLRARLQEYII